MTTVIEPPPWVEAACRQPLSRLAERLLDASLLAPLGGNRERRLRAHLAAVPADSRNQAIGTFVALVNDWRRLRRAGDQVNARMTWETLESHARGMAAEVEFYGRRAGAR